MKALSCMYRKTVMSWAIIIGALFVQPAIAKSLVICNGPSASVEINQSGGSGGPLQMIIHNSDFTQNCIVNGVINASELDAQGDLTVPMDEAGGARLTNRYFALDADGVGGYIFTVRYVSADGQSFDRVLSNYHFVKTGCQTNR